MRASPFTVLGAGAAGLDAKAGSGEEENASEGKSSSSSLADLSFLALEKPWSAS